MVAATIYEGLQKTDVEEAWIKGSELVVKHFPIGLHSLRTYPKEEEREAMFDYSLHRSRRSYGLMMISLKMTFG